MISKLKNYIAASLAVMVIGGGVVALAAPQTASAQSCESKSRFLTFPTWFRGLTNDNCEIISPKDAPGGLSGFIWRIVLNLVEIGLILVGWVSVGMILFGGYQLFISSGMPDKRAKAQQTITYAVVALVISAAAIGLTNFVFRAVL